MRYFGHIIIVVATMLVTGYAFAQTPGDYYCVPPKNQPRRDKHMNCMDMSRHRQGLWKFYSGSQLLLNEINYKDNKMHGQCVWYFATIGTIRVNANYFDGKRDGEYVANFFNGQTQMEGSFDYGRKTGTWTYYYSTTGEVRCTGAYVNGKMNGPWKFYTSKGLLKKTIEYKNGEAISTTYPTTPTTKPLASPETKPASKP